MTLATHINDDLEFIIDSETGAVFMSVSGYARMANVDKSTVSRRLKTVAQDNLKKAEIHTTSGLKTVVLIDSETIFDWLMSDNKHLARKMGNVGTTVYLHQLAGYKIQSTGATLQ